MKYDVPHYDIAIIGSGIAGATLASCFGNAKSVCVVDMEKQAGYHATARSAAMFIKTFGNAPVRQLTVLSEPYFTNPKTLFTNQDLLHPRGELVFCQPGEEAKWQCDIIDADTESMGNRMHVSAKKALAMVPIIKSSCVLDAIYDPEARDIDVDILHQSALRQFKNNGGSLLLDNEITSLSPNDHVDKKWRLQGKQGDITAKIVVNAAGAWAEKVGVMAGATRCPMQAMRRSVAIIPEPVGFDTSHWPLFASIDEKWYAKTQSGKLLVSPAEEDPVEPHDAFPEDMLIAQALYDFEQCVDMTVDRLEHQWAGLRTFTEDRTPVVGFDAQADNFFWLAGQGGYGIQTAPALSRLAYDLLQQKPLHDVTMQNLATQISPQRFNGVKA